MVRANVLEFFERNIFSQNIRTLLMHVTNFFEEELKEVWRRFLIDSEGISLVGFGSLGRRTMTPFSDIDVILLISSKKMEQKYGDMISSFIAALWDKGFSKIEHSVRTPEETLKLALHDVKVLSYLIDLRFIAGDYKPFEKLNRLKRKFYISQREHIFDTLYQERLIRLSKFSNYLEPNIKNSPGGVNDFLYQKCIRSMVSTDVIVPVSEFKRAYDFLLEIRSVLHYVLKKNDDTLNPWNANDVVEFIRKKKDEKQDVRKFMFKLLGNMHKIKVLTDIVQEQTEKKLKYYKQEKISRLGDRFSTDGRFLYIDELQPLKASVVIELFKLAKDNNLRISPELAYKIYKSKKITRNCWMDQEAVKIAYGMISELGGIGRTLHYMRDLEVLYHLIPELKVVRNLYQVSPPHIYPVDMHLIKSVEEVEKILLGVKPPYVSFLPEISQERRRLLILSSLLHDIGKGRKRDHSEVGERLSEKVGKRFGIVGENLKILKFLVKHHLMLPHFAQRRDIHETSYLRKVAELFPDTVSLDMLYIISIADALATNPNNWNSWKAHLISEMYVKLSEHIRKGLEYAEETRIDVSLLVEDLKKFFPTEIVTQAIHSLSQKFLSFFTYDRIFRYMLFLLKAYFTQSRYVAFTKRDEGVIEIITIGDDIEGFLCECAGMLFVSGFNILSLYAEGAVLGKAINIFWVEPPDVGKFRRFEKIFYSKRLEDIVGEVQDKKRKLIPYYMETNPFASQNTEKTIKVIFDNNSSENYTIIEVYCFDRPALLFDISYTITFSGYDISVAKISTRENKVADVFYIRDKRKSPGKLSEDQFKILEEKIVSAIIQGIPPSQ